MATFVMKNPYVSVNSVDLTAWVKSVTVNIGTESVDVTASSTAGMRIYLPGLKTASVEVEFFEDYASGGPEQTLDNMFYSGTTYAVAVRPTSSASSATNPEYGGTMMLESFDVTAGSVGDAAMAKAVFKPTGTFARTPTPT